MTLIVNVVVLRFNERSIMVDSKAGIGIAVSQWEWMGQALFAVIVVSSYTVRTSGSASVLIQTHQKQRKR